MGGPTLEFSGSDCVRPKAPRLLPRPATHMLTDLTCPGYGVGKQIASAVTEGGAGAVRCNELLGPACFPSRRTNGQNLVSSSDQRRRPACPVPAMFDPPNVIRALQLLEPTNAFIAVRTLQAGCRAENTQQCGN